MSYIQEHLRLVIYIYDETYSDTGTCWSYDIIPRYDLESIPVTRGKTPAIAEFPPYPVPGTLTTKHINPANLIRRQPLSLSGFKGRVAKQRLNRR